MKNFPGPALCVIVTLLAASPAGARGMVPSLCRGGEEVVFSCNLADAPKAVALCAARGPRGQYLQFRIGRPGALELEFPPRREDYLTLFSYTHVFPHGADDSSLRFMNGATSYELFSQIRMPPAYPPSTRRGLHVMAPGRAVRTHVCGAGAVDRLSQLEGILGR